MAKKNLSDETITPENENVKETLTCGIVMPISSIANCSAEHWKEVQEILKDAITSAGFIARLVSESDDSGIIQKRIIQNLYSDPIVICDVSGKNPNVMFELGMRLAFDKPTIVVKDDKTDYSFDTSPLEHIPYPRDLRFASIVKFKESLIDKINGTYKRANEDKNYTTFLKHFGKFKVAELEERVIGKEDFIIKSIEDLREEVRRISSKTRIVNESTIERMNFDKMNFTEQERYDIVKSKVEDFFREQDIPISRITEIEADSMKLFKYLEGFREVRRSCGNPSTIKKTMDFVLSNIRDDN